MSVATISNILAKQIAINDDPEDLEVISYGLEGIISSLLNTAIAFVISVFTGTIIELIMLCIIFIPVRCMHKGYHCQTLLTCVLYSNIMIAIATYILHIMALQDWMFVGIIFIVGIHYCISIEKYKLLNILLLIGFYGFTFINKQIACCLFISIVLNCILISGRKLHEE